MSRRAVIAAGGGAQRAALRRVVSDAGLAVAAESADAWSAIAAAVRERPHVCILDARLPGGALVAAAAITQSASRPAVLVVDENGSNALARAAELVGAVYLRGEVEALLTTSLHDRSLPRGPQRSLNDPPTAA